MKKIKIIKTFPTTHLGMLVGGKEYSVANGFADYVVLRMKNATYIEVKKPRKTKVKK